MPRIRTLLLLAAGVGAVALRRRRKINDARFNRRARITIVLAIAVSIAQSQASSAAHAAEIRTVALSGQQAPGAPEGVVFSQVVTSQGMYLTLNDAGQTAFYAQLRTGSGIDLTNRSGIWSEGSGSLARVVNNSSGGQVRDLVLNDAGQIAFVGDLPDGRGIWSDRSGSLAMVARGGEQAPGTPDGVSFYGPGFQELRLNNAGQIAFAAFPSGTGVDTLNDGGIWSEGSGSLSLVARHGQQVPGMPEGVSFRIDPRHQTSYALNDAGQTAFSANITDSAGIATNDTGIWATDRTGALQLLVRDGDHPPGTPIAVSFGPSHLAFNNAGQVAFSNGGAIWSQGSGSLTLVARAGDHAPGTPSGVTFLGTPITFGTFPVLNDAGQTAFNATLAGNGVDSTNDGSIWSEGSGSLALVAREGDHAPGTPDGVNFGSVYLQRLVLNAAGQTAFSASLTGSGVDSTNNTGIWATDRRGDLQLIGREGGVLEVSPGDFRTIREFYGSPFTTSTGNSDGRRNLFNNRGQLAFAAIFTDGSSGIFVSNRVAVPEPSTLFLIGAGVGVIALRRRRGARKDKICDPRINTLERISVVLALVVSITLAMSSTTAHAADIRTVALSGQQAPGMPEGVVFLITNAGSGFSAPVLNDAGQTAFISRLAGSGVDTTNSNSIWSEGSGSLALVARTGTQAPGTASGVNYLSFSTPSLVLNDVGQIAFRAYLTGSGAGFVNHPGIWSGGSGSLALVAREGEHAPGTPSGVNFDRNISLPRLNNAGQTAFTSGLTGASVDSTNYYGVWSEGSGSLALAARGGQQAPGAPSGVNFGSAFAFGTPALNDAGQTAFFANLTGNEVPFSDRGIWSEGSGSLASVALGGSQAPGTPSGVNFFQFDSSNPIGATTLNNAGQTTFYAQLFGGGVDFPCNRGIWSERTDDSLTLVVRGGDRAPGLPGDETFHLTSQVYPVLNDAGQIAFADVGSIWVEDSGSLMLVARSASQAPGAPSGVNFAGFDYDSLVLNSAGQMAFGGSVFGNGVDATTNDGIWATDRSGALQLIVREGDLLEVAPGDFRTIYGTDLPSALGFTANTGNSDGRPSGFNNRGQLAFSARFTDGSSGIFVSDRVAVPEPSTLLLLCLGSLAVLWRRRGLVCTSILIALLASPVPDVHAAEIRTVALSGQQAPGAPAGVKYETFGRTPALNDAGQVALHGNVTGGSGIWSEGSGSLDLVARSGSQAPDTPSGANFFSFADLSLVLNDVGETTFFAILVGSGGGVVSTNNQGIWSEGSGSLSLVARRGDHAPGTPGGVTYNNIRVSPLTLNNAGQTAFLANLSGGGVDANNNTGIWSEGPGSLALVALSGQQAADTPSGVNYRFTSGSSPPVLNDAGRTAFWAELTGSGVDATNDGGIWSESSGSLALVAREGDHAPGTSAGVNFSRFGFGSIVLNKSGGTAFRATLTDGGDGIWSDGSGGAALVARSGNHAPGAPIGVNFGLFDTFLPVLNDAGQIAFTARLAGSGVDAINDRGIWSEGSGSLAMVARAGDHAPGTPSGVSFGGFAINALALNDAGQIVFLADLSDISRGIWATDRSGELQLIAREGDLLEVAPGDFRTIHGFGEFGSDGLGFTANTGNSDGRPSGFNNLGQLAFYARFTDGTSGVFVSNRVAVPEPSSVLLITGAGLFLLKRRVGKRVPKLIIE